MIAQIIVLSVVLLIFFGTVNMKINNPLILNHQKDLDRTLSIQAEHEGNWVPAIPIHSFRDRITAAWHIIRGKGFCLKVKQ